MKSLLKEAMAEVARLPEATQDKIGEELLLHVDKVRQLRAKLEKGIASLESDEGRELQIKDILKRARTA
ncbi:MULTISPECIES: hypothetical protein [unclassified Bradyrhizobium]|uniref:hypothetical protein n=1 Tax=Bradyrhizobium sp. USDA 4541 TaxID=2817704 RepID=UPI0020A47295|nr:hypothetical protein [Bradyrhizobium sp. USDA 4541]MCP1846793.1 hypothetical protein [Bradyrhizobium sp. USDA 4541]